MQILRLAGPLILGQVAVMGMTVTDIYMVGQLGADDLAAVQIGGSLWQIVSLLLIGVMLGNNPLVGQLHGAGRADAVRHQFQQALWLAIPVGLVMASAVAIGMGIVDWIGIPDPIVELTRAYLLPFLGTAVLMTLVFAFRGTFEGIGDTRPVMVFNSCAFLLNILLDYLLVFGHLGFPALGSRGAAWATFAVTLFLLAGLACHARFSRTLRPFRLFLPFDSPDRESLRKILALGIPISLYMGAEFSFFSVIPLFLAHLGPAVVGAHAVAINVDAVAFMIPVGISQALTILVAHSIGRGDAIAARHIAITAFKIALIVGLCAAVVKIALRHTLAAWFTPDPQVRAIAANLLIVAALLGSIDCLQINAGGALRGYRDARTPLLLQIAAFWGIAFPIAYSLALTDFWGAPLGVYGFWLGMVVAVSFAGLFLVTRWHLVSSRAIRSELSDS